MDANIRAMWELHVRFASGETLTVEEQAALDRWYEEQDQAEASEYHYVQHTIDNAALQNQVNALLDKVATTTETIRRLNTENEVLRREVAELRKQVAKQAALELA